MAQAETLAEALSLAYRSNPTLQQARAQQRALDETDVQARVGWRPTVSVTASDDYEHVFDANRRSDVSDGGATLNLSQPLYTGGRTAAAVRAADAAIAAGRDGLRASEASVILGVITSYEDVLRDQRLLDSRDEDIRTLGRVRDEVGAKREVGQITRTDVVQIDAQAAQAEAARVLAQAQLQVSRAQYATLVGRNPGTLEPPPPLPDLPKTIDDAFQAAERDNPTLQQAIHTELASREKVAGARAAFLPSVAATAQLGYLGSNQPAQTIDYSKALSAQITLTQPLFTGGLNGSMLRQALEQNAADREAVEIARRQADQAVAQAWNQLVANRRARDADAKALEAAELELTGMQEEYRLAIRSTLEVLEADETVRTVQESLAAADHDVYVAEAALLSADGRLRLERLVVDERPYDAVKHLRIVRGKGATPYEPVIAGLDGLLSPKAHAAPAPAEPPSPASPPAIGPGVLPPPDAPMITQLPEPARP